MINSANQIGQISVTSPITQPDSQIKAVLHCLIDIIGPMRTHASPHVEEFKDISTTQWTQVLHYIKLGRIK